MELKELLANKEIKTKEKTETISSLLLEKKVSLSDLLRFAQEEKDPNKATCIEAIEFATKIQANIMTTEAFAFVCVNLAAKAPRIKWESAKVIGNTAHLFPKDLVEAIKNLLINSEHEGTVVRWSAAFALGEILKLKTSHNSDLVPACEAICQREEKNSIQKIYLAAIKKIS